MPNEDAERWCPLRARAEDRERIAADVAGIAAIQTRALAENGSLKVADRVAHQYQIAGGKVMLTVADALPGAARGVGLFLPGARHVGIGRVSTGLGTPHAEPSPDFLGLLLAFQTAAGMRVDFLAINDPAAPAGDHRDFMSILHATGAAAGAKVPFVGELGDRDLLDLAASQSVFAVALARRMGVIEAGRTMRHLMKQAATTLHSSSAYQRYWTGIVELKGEAGKFAIVPVHDDNPRPGLHPGDRLFTRDWRERQQRGDLEFRLYWLAYLDEARTPTRGLTRPWEEGHGQLVATVAFPRADASSEEARLWSMLAAEMGGNPGNWIADEAATIREPSTEFGLARQVAYAASQRGRDALPMDAYRHVFTTGLIADDLAQELRGRREAKARAGHVDRAP